MPGVLRYTLILALVVLAAGCGSSGSNSTTTSAQAQRVDWANSVCAPLVAWESSVKATASQLRSSQMPAKGKLADAATQVEDATKTLVNSLKSVGQPPTPASDEAKSTVDNLESQLSDGANQMKSDVSGISGAQDLLTATTSVEATAKQMRSDISSATSKLQSLGSNGEWKQAFSDADSCKTLQGS